MEEFIDRLNKIDGAYDSFMAAVLTYVKKKKERFEIVNAYIIDHPNASTSDILGFISFQPDFYEDAVY